MPLLDIKLSHEITVETSLEQSTAFQVEHYAAFMKVPADEVIQHSLEYVFAKDKDFQAYLEKHPNAPEFNSLRVQQNGSKPGRKAGSSNGN